MEAASRKDIQRLFLRSRISNGWGGIMVLPYFPIGILFVILRTCLLLNFIIARQLLSLIFVEESAIFKAVNRLFLAILGIWVKLNGTLQHANLIVCNQTSHIDGIVFCHSVNVYCEDTWGLSPFVCKMLHLVRKKEAFKVSNSAAGKVKTTVVFPECCPTSGTGIMQFDESYFSRICSYQSCAISVKRLMLPVSLSTISSGFWSDLFWTFFCPVTFYTITFSKTCTNRNDMEEAEYASAASSEIAHILHIPKLSISIHDKMEYSKRLQLERSKPKASSSYPSRLLQMATKVQEVTPHVPKDVILADLAKTDCVDVTLANIFEGVVKFTPIEPGNSKPEEKPHKFLEREPRTLLEKRKVELYELARRRYKEKHGL